MYLAILSYFYKDCYLQSCITHNFLNYQTVHPEIEIQECQRKRKGNIQSPNEEERTMKMRITNRNYQMNKEERRRREENKEKVNRNRQEEERIEADTL